jgi:predicted Zn-dependent peptidase
VNLRDAPDEAAFREEVDRALKDGFTAEEVAAAKSGYLQSRQVTRAQDSGLASRLTNYRFIGRTMEWGKRILFFIHVCKAEFYSRYSGT